MLLKKLILILLFSPFLAVTLASNDTIITPSNWEYKAKSSFNISQIAFKDWAQGGSNTLTWLVLFNSSANYSDSIIGFRNTLKVSYGRTKIEDEGFKTNDNELFLESIFSRKFGWAIDPFFSFSLRTPITKGYSYKKLPPVKISNFFDPGYLTQTVGFTYDKFSYIKTRLGLALKQTFTDEFRNYSDNPATKDKIEKFKLETGFECVTDSELKIDTNILFKTSLRLFTTFDNLDVWDVRWDNSITAKINSYMNVNFNFLVLYEKNQSFRTQIKESLLLGITYTLF